ncbi:MAG: leucyl/phenylalanyl-tRNA--protein transferase [Chloroflexota bacterium]
MDLTPQLLLSAYCQGIFPMAHDDGQIYWHDPNPRAILPLVDFHVSRSLARTIKKRPFTIRANSDFERVIRACAAPAAGRCQTWISEEIIAAYTELHRLGVAHTVEAWQNGRLVGGLYGVAVGGLFAGESMFHYERDASKVALVHLVHRLRQGGFRLLDIQFMTDHLAQFGAIEIPRAVYKARLRQALQVQGQFATTI